MQTGSSSPVERNDHDAEPLVHDFLQEVHRETAHPDPHRTSSDGGNESLNIGGHANWNENINSDCHCHHDHEQSQSTPSGMVPISTLSEPPIGDDVEATNPFRAMGRDPSSHVGNNIDEENHDTTGKDRFWGGHSNDKEDESNPVNQHGLGINHSSDKTSKGSDDYDDCDQLLNQMCRKVKDSGEPRCSPNVPCHVSRSTCHVGFVGTQMECVVVEKASYLVDVQGGRTEIQP